MSTSRRKRYHFIRECYWVFLIEYRRVKVNELQIMNAVIKVTRCLSRYQRKSKKNEQIINNEYHLKENDRGHFLSNGIHYLLFVLFFFSSHYRRHLKNVEIVHKLKYL